MWNLALILNFCHIWSTWGFEMKQHFLIDRHVSSEPGLASCFFQFSSSFVPISCLLSCHTKSDFSYPPGDHHTKSFLEFIHLYHHTTLDPVTIIFMYHVSRPFQSTWIIKLTGSNHKSPLSSALFFISHDTCTSVTWHLYICHMTLVHLSHDTCTSVTLITHIPVLSNLNTFFTFIIYLFNYMLETPCQSLDTTEMSWCMFIGPSWWSLAELKVTQPVSDCLLCCVQRLKHIVPRQADVDQETVMSRFHQKQLDMEKVAFRERFEEQERCQRQLQEQRLKLMRDFKQQQLRNSETLAKIQSVYTQTDRQIQGDTQRGTDRLTDIHTDTQRLTQMTEFKRQQLHNSETLAKIQSVYTQTQTDRLTDMSAIVDVTERPNISIQ